MGREQKRMCVSYLARGLHAENLMGGDDEDTLLHLVLLLVDPTQVVHVTIIIELSQKDLCELYRTTRT